MGLREKIESYVGGQMEIQNQREGHLYRGEIERISVEDNEVRVRFSWLAKGKGFPPVPTEWVADDKLDYAASLDIYNVSEIDNGRVLLESPFVGELAVLYPQGGSRLDPSKVNGLDTKVE